MKIKEIGLTDFSYNAAMHLAIKQLLFKVAYVVKQLQLVDLSLKGAHSTLEFNHDGEDLVQKYEQVLE